MTFNNKNNVVSYHHSYDTQKRNLICCKCKYMEITRYKLINTIFKTIMMYIVYIYKYNNVVCDFRRIC